MADPLSDLLAQYSRPEDADVAGTPFERVRPQHQMQNYRDRTAGNAAWQAAEGSPWKPSEPGAIGKAIGAVLESKPVSDAINMSAFIGPAGASFLRRPASSWGSSGAMERALLAWRRGGTTPEALRDVWFKEGWAPANAFGPVAKGSQPMTWVDAPGAHLDPKVLERTGTKSYKIGDVYKDAGPLFMASGRNNIKDAVADVRISKGRPLNGGAFEDGSGIRLEGAQGAKSRYLPEVMDHEIAHLLGIPQGAPMPLPRPADWSGAPTTSAQSIMNEFRDRQPRSRGFLGRSTVDHILDDAVNRAQGAAGYFHQSHERAANQAAEMRPWSREQVREYGMPGQLDIYRNDARMAGPYREAVIQKTPMLDQFTFEDLVRPIRP